MILTRHVGFFNHRFWDKVIHVDSYNQSEQEEQEH